MAVKTFQVSTEYDRQAAEARKRRRMADLLAQQVVEPTQYGPGPTPAAAPLVQGLQAFLAARAGRKADEAEEGVASAQARAGEQISNYLFGGGRMPKTAADLTEVTPAGKLQPQTAADLTEVTPEGAYIEPYEKDPAAALRLALTPAGGAAMKGNPMLAAMLARSMEKPKQLEIGAIDLSKLTPESARRFAVSGNPTDIEYRPETPESRIGKPSFGDFTPRSLEEYNRTGDPNVLVSITKPGAGVGISAGGVGKSPVASANPFLTPEEAQGFGFAPGTIVRRKDMVVVQQPPKQSGDNTTVAEQTTGWNVSRILNAANEISDIAKTDPDAVKPGFLETVAGGFGEEPAGSTRSANRQIIVGAQSDMLDALITLATGAAYTQEQAIAARRSYLPTLTDKPETVQAKRRRLAAQIPAARKRAGSAWTPELETAAQGLLKDLYPERGSTKSGASAPAAPSSVFDAADEILKRSQPATRGQP